MASSGRHFVDVSESLDIYRDILKLRHLHAFFLKTHNKKLEYKYKSMKSI